MAKKRSSRRRRKSRRVNLKLIGIVLGATLLAGLGTFSLHSFQMLGFAAELRQRAQKLQDEDKPGEAIRYLKQYLGFEPKDISSRATLGILLEEVATQPPLQPRQLQQASSTYERVLRDDPERSDIRRRLVDLKIAFRRFRDAKKDIEYLLDAKPKDGELEYKLALCFEAENDNRDALEMYETALSHGYGEIEVYVHLAMLHRREFDDAKQADEIIERMIEANLDSDVAYLRQASYQRSFGSIKEALESAKEAARLSPDNVDAILMIADLVLGNPESDDEAREFAVANLEKGLAGHPDDSRLYRAVSQFKLQAGETNEAIAAIRRGQEKMPDRPDLTWMLADMLISDNKLDEAEKQIARLRELDSPPIFLNYLEGRLLMLKGDLLQAKQKLTDVRNSRVASRNSQLLTLARINLGNCHRLMGNFEEQLAEFRLVLELDPQSTEAKLGMASALASLGRIDDALGEYRGLENIPGIPIQVARLQFLRNMRLPDAKKNWEAIEDTLNKAEKLSPESIEVVLLRADILQTRGEGEKARRLLEELVAKNPKSIDAWTTLARLEIRLENWDEAASFLDDAEKQTGDSVALRLARAAYWGFRGTPNANEELIKLAGDADDFSHDQEIRLLEGLAAVHFRRNDLPSAQKLWKRVAELSPGNLRAQFRFFTLSLAMGDDSSATTAIDRIRAIEGDEGPNVRAATVLRMIARYQGKNKSVLQEARSLLSRIAVKRPSWSLVPLNLARIDELEGNLESAFENYRRAIELGNRDPVVLRRAIELLLSQERYADADRLIQQLQSTASAAVTKQVRQMAAELSLRRLDLERATSLAEQAIQSDSSNYRDHIWLGQMQAATRRNDEAKKSFQKAVELEPERADAWVVYVLYLVRSNQADAAKDVVAQATEKLPPETSQLALALCYEAVGDIETAEKNNLAALKKDEKNPALKQNLAAFYLRTNQSDKSEPLLRELLDKNVESANSLKAWARRSLSVAIAQRDYQHFQEALKILDGNTSGSSDARADQRVKARLLATRATPQHLREAITILETLDRDQALGAQDQHLLARMNDAIGETRKADDWWQKLLAANERNPVYISAYVRRLITRDDLDDGDKWLKRLAKLEPNSFPTAELSARLLVKGDKVDEALALLSSHIKNKDAVVTDRIDRVAQAAALAGTLGNQIQNQAENGQKLNQQAERWYREALKDKPAIALPFAMFLGRLQRVDEALDLCEEVTKTDRKYDAIATSIGLLRSVAPSEEQTGRIENWLEAAIAGDADSIIAMVQFADLRDLQGRYELAEELHRKILDKSPRHVVALNNLAWLLSMYDRKHDEAKKLIDRAIEVSGPAAVLIDTRGTILLNGGDSQKASEEFREAIDQAESASTRFHLAQAFWGEKNERAARFNLKKARTAGLDIDQLHPLERDAYRKLVAELGETKK